MRAGRPRGFCVEDALDRAMTIFWRHGYEGASMSELTAAMGINSPSLYACFGSKEGLFRAVLERYDERRKSFMDYVMAAPDVAQMAERFLHGVADFAADTSGKTPPGCLLLAERPFVRRFPNSRRIGAPSRRKGNRPAATPGACAQERRFAQERRPRRISALSAHGFQRHLRAGNIRRLRQGIARSRGHGLDGMARRGDQACQIPIFGDSGSRS